MSEPTTDQQLDEFLEIRKPGAHLEEGAVADDFVLMLGVDLTNYPKFPRVDDRVTYPKAELDIRQQLDVDSGAELPDYAGPARAGHPIAAFTSRLADGRPFTQQDLQDGRPSAIVFFRGRW